MGEKEVMVACARGCKEVQMSDGKTTRKSAESLNILTARVEFYCQNLCVRYTKNDSDRKEIQSAYLGPRLFGFVNQHKVAQSNSECNAFEEARIHLPMNQRVRVKQRHETRQKRNGIIDIKKL
jgi:hypothetical protein